MDVAPKSRIKFALAILRKNAMRLAALLLLTTLAGCNTAPTGTPGMATSGAGPQPGASAGASVGGGPLGTGTADNPAGAK